VTVPLAGGAGGAVNEPSTVTVPVAVALPATPFTCQVTPSFSEAPETVAVNCRAPPTATVGFLGKMETEIGELAELTFPVHDAAVSSPTPRVMGARSRIDG
jgi:hypothetical protein